VILRLLSYNIRYGGTGRERALAATIRSVDPDLVVFQEATRPEVVERIAGATGMTSWASTRDHSVGYMSRLPIASHAWHRPLASRRAFLELVLEGSNLRVFGVHLSALHSNWTERWRIRELEGLLASIDRHHDGLHLLAGDFNTLAPGETLDIHRLPLHLRFLAVLGGQTIHWRTIQTMLDAQYVDAYRLLHPLGRGYTFPTWDPNLRLDYVFVPQAASGAVKSCEVVDGAEANAASDHLPLLAEVSI
jgi:exodeoxyribonuclease III